jgi:plastocyanin
MKELLRQRFAVSLITALMGVLAVVLAASPVFAGRDAGSSQSSRERVSVRDDRFSPRSVTVSVRGKVTWRWRGDNPHNVRFRRVPSGASKRGSDTQTSGRFARTFRKRGRYSYVCTIHEDIGMRGSVRAE